MVLLNTTGIIGSIMVAGTEGLTGDMVATLLIVLLFLVVIGIMFSIPMEYLSIIIIPFCLATATYYNQFIIPLLIIGIYLSVIITKNWLFK